MSRSRTARRAAPVAACLGLLAGCGEPELPLARVRDGQAEITGQGVLVVVVDGLRWDHTSLAGYDRDTTPFLLGRALRGRELRGARRESLLGRGSALLARGRGVS